MSRFFSDVVSGIFKGSRRPGTVFFPAFSPYLRLITNVVPFIFFPQEAQTILYVLFHLQNFGSALKRTPGRSNARGASSAAFWAHLDAERQLPKSWEKQMWERREFDPSELRNLSLSPSASNLAQSSLTALMIPESENVSLFLLLLLLHSLIHLTGSRCPGSLLENSGIRLNNSINIRNVASRHSAANEAN